MMLLTGLEKLFLPVSNIDDRMYRASRAGYWLQERTLALPDLHNDRLTAFPPGGSLPFFWAILFTRDEIAGQVAMWLAYPLVAAGLFVLLREARLSRAASVLGALVYCFTPIVLLHTRGVQPEQWFALFTVGCGFWVLRAARGRRCAAVAAVGWACLFAVLAVNVRATALPLVVMVLLLAPLLAKGRRLRATACGVAGGAVALAFSGLGLILVNNVRLYGAPFGSPSFRRVHTSDVSLRQLRTHAGRAIVVLMEPPLLTSERARRGWEDLSNRVLDGLGADQWLPHEEEVWPGHWVPQAKRVAENYSLPGWLWLPGLAVALAGALWRFARRPGGRFRWRPAPLLALLSTPFFLAVVLGVRWMGLMPRFWIAPYALGVAVLAILFAGAARRRRWVGCVGVALVLIFAIPAAWVRARSFWTDVTHPPAEEAIDEPYAEPLARIPDGSRILLAAGQSARDYPLFRPRAGFANQVFSWGKRPFDPQRLRALVRRHGITYVLIDNDRELWFFWAPPVATGPMVAWLERQPDFRQIPLRTPGRRLFEHVSATATRPAAAARPRYPGK
jgi:hypothetical protein